MAIWRALQLLSLLVWAAMLVLYVVGMAVPVVPFDERGDQQPGNCYNFISRIGTPLFLCVETGFDESLEGMLTTAWLWVHPPSLLLAALQAKFYSTAAAWLLATVGALAFGARAIRGRRKPR